MTALSKQLCILLLCLDFTGIITLGFNAEEILNKSWFVVTDDRITMSLERDKNGLFIHHHRTQHTYDKVTERHK